MSSTPTTPSRLLVVDDDTTALLICRTHFEKAGYEVVTALSVAQGRDRISQLGAQSFEAVFTDYRMPHENGLVMLKHVLGVDETLSVIVMTAEGERDLVMSSLREGAHDFIDKPLTRNVLLDVAQAAVASTRQKRTLAADAQAARAVGSSQRALLGRETDSGNARLRLCYHPHETAGGDFAASFQLDDHRFIVLISDVSGHDLRAAYHSAYLQGLARGLLQGGLGLHQVFQNINRLLLSEWNSGGHIELSLAACAICVDQSTQTLTILNCGLPNPLASDANGWVGAQPLHGSSPLGWFDDISEIVTRPLGEGLLHFWSDGLDDLAAVLGVASLALAYRLKEPGAEHRDLLDAAKDDIIVGHLDLNPTPGGDPKRHPLIDETYSAADRGEIDSIQARVERSLLLALPNLPEERLIGALVCIREALLNALEHGCGNHPDRRAYLKVSYDPTDRQLHVLVADDGDGHDFDFETHEIEAADQLHEEHRGLIMIKNLATRIHLDGAGSRLSMELPTSPTSSQP